VAPGADVLVVGRSVVVAAKLPVVVAANAPGGAAHGYDETFRQDPKTPCGNEDICNGPNLDQ